jgi:ATP synthase I chain
MIIISFLLMWKYASDAFELAYCLGGLVGIVNGIIGFLTIEKFIDKSSLAFLKGVFIGMGIRLLLLLGIFIVLVKLFEVHIVGLVTGLLIFYFAMTIFEVTFLNKRIEIKRTMGASS